MPSQVAAQWSETAESVIVTASRYRRLSVPVDRRLPSGRHAGARPDGAAGSQETRASSTWRPMRRDQRSVSNSARLSRRWSFEKTSIGFSVGSRIPRCRIRIWVCWLYSTSVIAQPSRPARAVRPDRWR